MENINLFRFILNTPEDNHGHMMDWPYDGPHMNAELWMIIIILFNIVGIILYFLVRDTPSTNIYNTHNEVQVQ